MEEALNSTDMFNACFELGGAALTLLSVRALMRDKKVRGFSPAPIVFFTVWGVWNLWFYSSLGQWFSMFASSTVLAVNAVWLLLIWKYRNE